jgi:hypothetical protein
LKKKIDPEIICFMLLFSIGLIVRFLFIRDNKEFLEDSYTWSIIAQETWANNGIYTDPFGGHNDIWLPLWGSVAALVTGFVPIEHDLMALRIFNSILSMTTLLIIWNLTRIGYEDRYKIVRLLFSLIYCINPLLIVHGTQATNIPLGCFLIACVLWIYHKFENHRKYFFAGVVIGLACLTRYEYWILIIFMIPYLLLIDKVKLKNFSLFIIPSIMLPASWALYRIKADGEESFVNHYLTGEGSKGSNLMGDAILNGWETVNIPLEFTWYLFIILFILLFSILKMDKEKSTKKPLALATLFCIIIYFEIVFLAFRGISPAWHRYHLLYLPIVIPLLGSGHLYDYINKTASEKVRTSEDSNGETNTNEVTNINVKNISHLKVILGIGVSLLIISLSYYDMIEYNSSYSELKIDYMAGEILEKEWEEKGGRILCDLPAVVVSSNIPIKYFDRTSELGWNQTAWLDIFIDWDIKFLVYTDRGYAFISYVGQYKIEHYSPPEITYTEIWNSTVYTNQEIIIYEITIDT